MVSFLCALIQEEVLFTTVGEKEKGGCYRLITLNRPKALNALNYNMIKLITADMKVGVCRVQNKCRWFLSSLWYFGIDVDDCCYRGVDNSSNVYQAILRISCISCYRF